MSFKTIAILTAAIASAATLAQQDRGHHDGGGRSSGSSHSSSSSSRSSSQSGRSSGNSQRQSYGGSNHSQSYGSRSGSYNRSQSSETRSHSIDYPGRSSYGNSRPSSNYSHSYGAGHSYSSNRTGSTSTSRWRDSENRTSSSIGRRDFGEQRGSVQSTRTFQDGHHDAATTHWSDRYTGGGVRSDHHTGTFRNDGFGHSSSGFHDGGRVFDRGRLGAHFDFIHQSHRWGGGWRTGWVRPSGFFFGLSFGFYLSDRFAAPCYVSPWYYYDCLPPYIPTSHCIVVPDYSCNWDAGNVYDWSDGDNNGDRALDDALAEIEDAFRNQNMDAVDRLVPSYGDVAVSTDGHYDYSLKANEFGQMFTDSVKGCDTVSFHVENVRKVGSYAIVRCTHDVHDKDSGMETVYQTYRLRMQEGRYVVTDFMTEHSSEF